MKVKFAPKAILVTCFAVLWFSLLITACKQEQNTNSTNTQLPIVSNPNTDSSTSAYPGVQNAYPGTAPFLPEVPIEQRGIISFDIPAEGIPTFPGKLAFHTERYGNLQVAILDGATGEITRLTQMSGQTFEPTWSPDCANMAFSVGVGVDEDFEIYIQNMNGDQATPLLANPDSYDWASSWSPTGNVIAYQNNRDARINICFADPNGTELGCMERGDFSNAMPAWSPDGTQLVFGSNREGNWELYLTDYPGMTSLKRLTNNTDIDFTPQFSPDGQTILFSSQRLGTYHLYTYDINSDTEYQLTFSGADERTPTWIGNDLIAYSAFIQEDWELYLVNKDGSNVQRLTYAKGKDQWPAWCAMP